ncbi:uncharacterized protein LOC106560015 isoform X1 [Canis lupus familiaris]|uniref:uncharacterized protein LOC106560015 isoform X1 n=1 Tax=Canis lupus familiaris TaxID=9615 RepID=UPI0018F7E113|nr:uncharacterized protein LOC106560015 isoform X1 [Canis lupus familiaris]
MLQVYDMMETWLSTQRPHAAQKKISLGFNSRDRALESGELPQKTSTSKWELLVTRSSKPVANVFDAALLEAEPKESERDFKIMPRKHPRAWGDVNDRVGCKSQFLNDLCSMSPVRKTDRQTDRQTTREGCRWDSG